MWIDKKGGLRSKTKVENFAKEPTLHDCKEWNFDGSSTGQAVANDSEVLLKPVAICKDPFRGGTSKLVLCETWLDDKDPHPTNTRWKAEKIFSMAGDKKPMFGLEQEFFFSKDGAPIAWLNDREPEAQGDYYCGVGLVDGRRCLEVVLKRCIWADLHITGANAEVAPSQWEIQICANGIQAADELYFLRYILGRTAEEFGWQLDLRAKPKKGDWNGSGCHVNFSTTDMRSPDGIEHIHSAIERLKEKHKVHIKWYGAGNEERLTGKHETSDINTFTSGAGDRGASVRLPTKVIENQCGYFEDRRPSSEMDPYVVTSLLFATSCDVSQEYFV